MLGNLGAGSTVQINSSFYTKDTNTFEMNISGAGAVPGTVDADQFGAVTKYAQLTLPGFLPVGDSVVVQINPALAEYDGLDEFVKLTDAGWTKNKKYEVEDEAEDFAVLIPGVPADVIIKLTHSGVTTTYVLHCDVTYA